MGQNGEGYPDSEWLSLWSPEKEEEEGQEFIRMERQIQLPAVFFVASFVEVKPAQSPAVSPHVVHYVIQVEKPTGQEAGDGSSDRTVAMIGGKTDTSGCDDVMHCSHRLELPFRLAYVPWRTEDNIQTLNDLLYTQIVPMFSQKARNKWHFGSVGQKRQTSPNH